MVTAKDYKLSGPFFTMLKNNTFCKDTQSLLPVISRRNRGRRREEFLNMDGRDLGGIGESTLSFTPNG